MTNPHRRAGADHEFGHRHPTLATLLGSDQAKAHAQDELGHRYWFWTLAGGRVTKIAALVVGGWFLVTHIAWSHLLVTAWTWTLDMAWPWGLVTLLVIGLVTAWRAIW